MRVLGESVPDPMETWSGIPERLEATGPFADLETTLTSCSCVRVGATGAAQTVAHKLSTLPQPSGTAVIRTSVAARHAAVRRAVLAALERSAFAEPTPVQMGAAPVILARRDLLAVAPTGSGKTAAYALPLILALQGHAAGVGPRALVLVPTKELASQVARESARLAVGTGIAVGVLTREVAEAAAGAHFGGVKPSKSRPRSSNNKRTQHAAGDAASSSDGSDAVDALPHAGEQVPPDVVASTRDARSQITRSVVSPMLPRFDIVIATPLTLLALMRHTAAAYVSTTAAPDGSVPPVPRVILPCLRFLVLDEADRLLDEGFVEQVDEVMGSMPDSTAIDAWLREERAEEAAHTPNAAVVPAVHDAGASGQTTTRPLPPTSRRPRHGQRTIDAVHAMLYMPSTPQPVPARSKRPRNGAVAPAAAAQDMTTVTPIRVCVAMFTATMPSGAEELAASVLRDHVRLLIGAVGGAASSVKQRLLFTGREEGKLLALRQLVADGGLRPPVLVFVQSKERADELATALRTELRLPAAAVHADQSADVRAATLHNFRRGDTWVLVTTELLGRGMDFPAVRLVINYDLPRTAVSYIHRIGRTGRGGREGDAVTFFTEADIPALRSIAHVMKLSGCTGVPQWMLALPRPPREGRGAAAERSIPRRAPIFRARTKFDAAQAKKARDAARGDTGDPDAETDLRDRDAGGTGAVAGEGVDGDASSSRRASKAPRLSAALVAPSAVGKKKRGQKASARDRARAASHKRQ